MRVKLTAMTLDPAPPLLGSDAGAGRGVDPAALDGTVDGGADGAGAADDEARLRATAHHQWLDRRALERQLHDGAALRISALALRLGLLSHAVPGAGQEFRQAVEGLQDELHLVLQELRDVAGLLYPPLLDEAGLGPALREAAARSAVPVGIDAPDERFGPVVEGAAYFALLGCLPPRGGVELPDGRVDGVRPGQGVDAGGRIEIAVRRDGDVLVLRVTGLPAHRAAHHAASMHDAVRLLGGTARTVAGIDGAPAGATDGGTPITVRIPCA